MEARADWLEALTVSESAEVAAATERYAASGADIAAMHKSDFPLPGLTPRLARIRRDVLDGRGFALLRGAPTYPGDIRRAAIAFFGIGCHFGNARTQNAQGHVLGHVRDLGH